MKVKEEGETLKNNALILDQNTKGGEIRVSIENFLERLRIN